MENDDAGRRAANLALIERSFAAVGAGDMDGQLELCTDDMTLELPYADPPKTLRGKDAIRAHVGPALGIFRFELRIDTVYECADPDLLVLEYTSEGHVATTGKAYANSYVGLVRFRDGRICWQREYYNPLVAKRALEAG
jgi:ketosteroid isomerase-like protein